MVLDIKIPNAEAVEKLGREVAKTPENIWVHSKEKGKIMVDARSIMALYSLIGMDCYLVAEDDINPNLLENIAKKSGVL